MAKMVEDVVLDQALNYVKTNANEIHALSAQATTRTEATTTFNLATLAITGTDWTGPAAGDTSGRKLAFNGKSGDTVDSSGTCNHVAVTSGTELLLNTTVTGQALTAGNALTYGAFDWEIQDPT